MANNVEFTDNTVRVLEAMEDAITAYLYEAGGELEAATKRNSRPGKYGRHDVKNSWQYRVDEAEKVATIGSPLEASYWEELGTGEHALNNDGRKGWWVYVEGNDVPRSNQKYYTEDEAIKTAAYLRNEKGLDAHATNGTEAHRPLHRAFTAKKGKLIKRLGSILGEKFNE